MAYSDEQKALALATLASCRGNCRAAAKFCAAHYDMDVSYEQIRTWSKGEHVNEDCQEILTEKKAALADELETLAYKLVAAAAGKVDDAPLKDTMIAAAVAIDKMQVLRGEPGTINENRTTSSHTERVAAILAVLTGGDDKPGLPSGNPDG